MINWEALSFWEKKENERTAIKGDAVMQLHLALEAVGCGLQTTFSVKFDLAFMLEKLLK